MKVGGGMVMGGVGWGVSQGLWVKGRRGQAVAEPARGLFWRMQWQCDNLGKERGWMRVGGWAGGGLNRRKANAYRWDGGWGAYWSAVCLLFRRSVANRGPGVYISQCRDEDAPSGDMEMYSRLCNLASLHVAYIFTHPTPQNVFGRRHWLQRSKSRDFFFWEEKKKPYSRLLKDERRTEYSWWLISRMVADWAHNQDNRFVFTSLSSAVDKIGK